MKIGILGVGHIGKTLAVKLSAAGHQVKVANSRGPHTVDPTILSSGAVAVESSDVARDVDAVILSIPLNKIPSAAPLLKNVDEKTVVIDTSNYYPARDEKIDAIESGEVESLWVAEQLGRRVAKAWNAIGSASLATEAGESGDPGRLAIPIAGDDEEDLRITSSLVDDTGFDPFVSGSLALSWRQQPGTPCYCTDLSIDEIPAALDAADRDRSARRRDIAVAAIAERFDGPGANPTTDFGVRLNRLLFM